MAEPGGSDNAASNSSGIAGGAALLALSFFVETSFRNDLFLMLFAVVRVDTPLLPVIVEVPLGSLDEVEVKAKDSRLDEGEDGPSLPLFLIRA